jgi:hypothetical protein
MLGDAKPSPWVGLCLAAVGVYGEKFTTWDVIQKAKKKEAADAETIRQKDEEIANLRKRAQEYKDASEKNRIPDEPDFKGRNTATVVEFKGDHASKSANRGRPAKT